LSRKFQRKEFQFGKKNRFDANCRGKFCGKNFCSARKIVREKKSVSMKTVAEISAERISVQQKKMCAKKNRFDENCRGNSAERISVRQKKIVREKKSFR
jgi:hypothetical protein